jgi:hypothetical protein
MMAMHQAILSAMSSHATYKAMAHAEEQIGIII